MLLLVKDLLRRALISKEDLSMSISVALPLCQL
jgi:hypothetical protein